MVSELLDQLGLFVGDRLQVDHESTFFLDLNEQLLHRVNASWDHPLPFLDFLDVEDAVTMTTAALAADLRSGRAREFLGGSRWAGKASFESFDKPWGWKDPRTVFSLPIWLRLFPQARIVCIIRNGIDVAKSLMVREQKLLKLRMQRFDGRMAKRSLRTYLDRAGYKGSVRCLKLAGGFDLWAEYVQQAEKHLAAISNPIHTLLYEDMLADPRRHLPELARFCQLETGDGVIENAIKKIDGSRALAFTSDPTAAAFFEQVKNTPWMVKYGYDRRA
jgi:hypothetical protein